MKHFTHYITRLIGVFAMLLACNITAVAEDITILINGKTTGIPSTASETATTITVSDQQFSLTNAKSTTSNDAANTPSNNQLHGGTSGGKTIFFTANSGWITNKAALGACIKKIRVKSGSGCSTSATFGIALGNTAYSSKPTTFTFTGETKNQNNIYEFTPSGSPTYFAIASTNNKHLQLSIEVTYSTTAVAVATPTFTPAPGTYTEAQTVTIECATEGAEICYTTDGSDPTDSQTAKYYSETGPINVASTTTIKAVAMNEQADFSDVAIATYTIQIPCTVTWSVNGTTTETTQTQGDVLSFPSDPATILDNSFRGWTAATSVNPDGTGITYLAADATVPTQATITYYAVFSKRSGTISTDTYNSSTTTTTWTKDFTDTYSSKPKFKMSNTGTSYVASPTYISPITEFSFTFKGNSVSGTSKLEVIATDKDNTSTTIKTYEANDIPTDATTENIVITSGEYYSIKVLYTKDKGNVAIDDFVVKYGEITYSDYTLTVPTSVDVTIGSTGFSTIYYSGKNLTVPAGVSAWTYSLNGDALQATESYPAGTTIPAGEGVVLYTTTPATYTFNFAETAGDKVAGNLLKGSDEATTKYAEAEGNQLYRLANGSKGVAFYLASQDGNSIAISAHKAYLEIPAAAAANIREFIMLPGQDDGTTAISAPNAATTATEFFDLAGRRISHATKGLYIINGKKVIK